MRILVTAASRHEATNEVAKAIADTIERAGIEVVTRRPEEVGHLSGYDAVVLGSAVYAGHWLRPAKDLVERTSSRMRTMPVWLFSTGPVGDPLKPDAPPIDVGPMMELSGAREHRLFGGRLDRRHLGFAEKAMVRMVGAADGDHRPWGEIEAWAEEIASTLNAATLAASSQAATKLLRSRAGRWRRRGCICHASIPRARAARHASMSNRDGRP